MINPASTIIRFCKFTRPAVDAVSCEWLSRSSQLERRRSIVLKQLEVTGAGKHGVAIWSHQNLFSAHNVIIDIDDCIISSCNLAGLKIEDLAVSALRINDSEFSSNDYGGVQLRQVHQKSNLP